MPLGQDILSRIMNVRWGAAGGGFAVCGTDGYYATPPQFDPVYFGVGAYSEDGTTWTTFREFENGSMAIAFYGRDLLIAGGGINGEEEGIAISTASLETILGDGPSDEGESSVGRNVANFGSIGYNVTDNLIYAVENSGVDSTGSGGKQTLHTYHLGTRSTKDDKPLILWAGDMFPGIDEVVKCEAPMTLVDKDGDSHTLEYDYSGASPRLLLDGEDITPFGGRLWRAAGGYNLKGELIIIATGYHLVEGDEHAVAWYLTEGSDDWIEIGGLWAGLGKGELESAGTAVAVPNL